MFKWIRRLILLAIIGGAALGYYLLRDEGLTISIGAEPIQKSIEKRFPVSKSMLLVLTLELSDPQLRLEEGSDRLFIRARAKVDLVGAKKLVGGYGTISSGIDFEPESGTFVLTDVIFERIEIDGISPTVTAQVDELANLLARKSLDRLPIYTMKPDQTKTQIARFLLRKVTVRDGKVHVTLGLR